MDNTNLIYYNVGRAEDFLPEIGRIVRLQNEEIAVFRTADDRIYALENKNPHPKATGGPLAEGIVSGHYLYDPLYDWKINLEDGLVQSPDEGQVKVYPVQINGEEVQIGIPV